MTRRRWHILIVVLCLVALFAPQAPADETAPKVYVILWFDTEDYMLPASDNATLRLARWLIQQGIRAVFKIVAARARRRHRGAEEARDRLPRALA